MKPKPVLDRIILGVDPGTIRCGYGIIHHTDAGLRMLAAGVIQLDKSGLSQPMRLKRIFESISGLIAEFKPDEMAVEAPFHGENVQSMLKLGRAQGVIMTAAMMRDVPIHEYAPSKVKVAVTGRGSASKAQVAALLPTLLPELKANPVVGPADATDALAVALCHWLQTGRAVPAPAAGRSRKPKAAGWAAFVAHNPDRVR